MPVSDKYSDCHCLCHCCLDCNEPLSEGTGMMGHGVSAWVAYYNRGLSQDYRCADGTHLW